MKAYFALSLLLIGFTANADTICETYIRDTKITLQQTSSGVKVKLESKAIAGSPLETIFDQGTKHFNSWLNGNHLTSLLISGTSRYALNMQIDGYKSHLALSTDGQGPTVILMREPIKCQ